MQEAMVALAANVGEADTHSLVSQGMACNPGRRSRIVVDVSASAEHDGFIVDLTSTGSLKATDSNEKE